MIRCVEEDGLPILYPFCRRDVFGCKIASQAQAYGTKAPFACFWVQTNQQGRVVAALSRLEQTAVLCASPEAELEEWETFLTMLGIRTLQCSGEREGLLEGKREARGVIMQLEGEAAESDLQADRKPHLTEIYALLDAAEEPGFPLPPFKQFYVDMSHRVRHGTARCIAIREEGALVSCAMTVAETTKHAVIGAVATLPEHRNQGYGAAVVRALTRDLWTEGKTIFLFRQQGRLRHFYENLGFRVYGTWREIML